MQARARSGWRNRKRTTKLTKVVVDDDDDDYQEEEEEEQDTCPVPLPTIFEQARMGSRKRPKPPVRQASRVAKRRVKNILDKQEREERQTQSS